MRLGRLVVGGLVALGLGLVHPPPAGADPARPTNDRSVVVALVPPTRGVRVDVVGGDAFLRLRVEAGRTVVVPGYRGEPYLRVDADGTVERNQRSPARWLNSSRYGPTTPPPASADATAPPEWQRVGGSGEYVWHDHRIHSMGGPVAPPPQWEVPLEVDGVAVVVQGTLTRLPAPSAWPWVVLAAAAGVVALALLAAGGRGRWAGLAVVVAAAVGSVVVGIAEARALPGAAGGGPLVVALPAVALAAGVAAVALARRPVVAAPLLAGAGVALVVWAARCRGVVDHTVLLAALPDALDRAVVAVGFGVGLAAVVAGTAAVLFPRRVAA